MPIHKIRYSSETPSTTFKRIISIYLNSRQYKIFIFGSRARGTAHSTSDRDIGILGPTPVSHTTLRRIRGAFQESPYRVDLVDFTNAVEPFKSQALQTTIAIQ